MPDTEPKREGAGEIQCTATARILKGNPNLIGKPGGFSGDTVGPVPVRSGSAAIIVSQFSDSRAKVRPFLDRIRGQTRGGQIFNGVSDIIGSTDVPNVQEFLRSKFPDALIIELVTGSDEGVTSITITVPNELGCPEDTKIQ